MGARQTLSTDVLRRLDDNEPGMDIHLDDHQRCWLVSEVFDVRSTRWGWQDDYIVAVQTGITVQCFSFPRELDENGYDSWDEYDEVVGTEVREQITTTWVVVE